MPDKKKSLKELEAEYLEKRKLHHDFRMGEHHLSFAEEAALSKEMDDLADLIHKLKRGNNR